MLMSQVNKDLKVCTNCHRLVDRTTHVCPVTQRSKIIRQRRIMQNKSRTERELTTQRWRKFRSKIILMDGGCCQRCLIKFGKIETQNLTIQHIKPRIYRPDLMYDPSNCVTLCQSCNSTLGLKGLDFPWTPKDRENNPLFKDIVL